MSLFNSPSFRQIRRRLKQPRRSARSGRPGRRPTNGRTRKLPLFVPLALIIIAVIMIVVSALSYLGRTASDMSMYESIDAVTLKINDILSRKMNEAGLDYGYFVSLEKDSEGSVVAITTNTLRVNTLSAEIIREMLGDDRSGEMEIAIPLGSLSGSEFLLGRGPRIPVKVQMLSSSTANFRNELTSAGINQTKHQILLDITVNIHIMVPWDVLETKVETEVLVAETVVVGKIPNVYLSGT